MTTITLTIDVNAPPPRCYDLARSMDAHTRSMQALGTAERIVGGRSTGLIHLGEEVEFEARHLGLMRRLRARITHASPYFTFTDQQTRGPFKSLTHTHTFEPLADGSTRVTDTITLQVGYGPLGPLIEHLIVAPHLRQLIAGHQRNLKAMAEGGQWSSLLPPS